MACCRALETPKDLTCQVCFDSFQQPTQLFVCGHIFCKVCVEGATKCPTCRSQIDYTKPATELIQRAVELLPVVCRSCAWRGTRAGSHSHRCETNNTQTLYSQYPRVSDEELYARATNKSTGSIFQEPGAVQGIPLCQTNLSPNTPASKGNHAKLF
ncbi:EF hand [Trypanosoma theileri]|uniref:EF hand n=1 Tax=Trypanosoma theileri TaxID=67003 RepID=A0A1X0NVM4_9TRYP|nr:EF hand [Trypanosoma theileri]ORC88766.1 EF hand [Trypanosoma theileri]